MLNFKNCAIFALLASAVVTTGCANRAEQDGLIPARTNENILRQRANTPLGQPRRDTIWDLFSNVDDPDTKIEVNKYIWSAAQEILNFMPIETADPFSGVIVYGYGRPPGGGSAYRATVYVQDPALDARSLNVALATSSGPASRDTIRAIEDAILTRARQLRIAEAAL